MFNNEDIISIFVFFSLLYILKPIQRELLCDRRYEGRNVSISGNIKTQVTTTTYFVDSQCRILATSHWVPQVAAILRAQRSCHACLCEDLAQGSEL